MASSGGPAKRWCYTVPVAPSATRGQHDIPLRYFGSRSLNVERPGSGSGSPKGPSTFLGAGSGGSAGHKKLKHSYLGIKVVKGRGSRNSAIKDAMSFVNSLNTTTLTDGEADELLSPFSTNQYSFEVMVLAAVKALIQSLEKIQWYAPMQPPSWADDLRFLGEWWVCFSDPNAEHVKRIHGAMLASQSNNSTPNTRSSTPRLRHNMNGTGGSLFLSSILMSPSGASNMSGGGAAGRVSPHFLPPLALRSPSPTLSLSSVPRRAAAAVVVIREEESTPKHIEGVDRDEGRPSSSLSRYIGRPITTPYMPFLSLEQRLNKGETDQFIADLTDRLHGRLYHMNLLHMNNIALIPDRMHVLMFGGIVALKQKRDPEDFDAAESSTSGSENYLTFRDDQMSYDVILQRDTTTPAGGDPLDVPEEKVARLGSSSASGGLKKPETSVHENLATLSFSICYIGSASLLVLLLGLSVLSRIPPFITNLDLSFNALTLPSLYTLTQLLPMTRITRISLRGNHLEGPDVAAFRDFLLEGATALEELDLSYTRLSSKQVCILIECLPRMEKLRVLLLDAIDIPAERSTTFLRACAMSNLWRVSLLGSAVAQKPSFMNLLTEACERHQRKYSKSKNSSKNNSSSENFTGTDSFFELLFSRSFAKGWRPPSVAALPDGFAAYTTNDPSLADSSTGYLCAGREVSLART